jgi:hypothetical protein
VVAASAFKAATGFAHKFDELTTVQTFADAFPSVARASSLA